MKLSRWRAHGGAVAVGLIVFAWSSLWPAWSQADDAAALEELRRTVEDLRAEVGARDALIAELAQRMGELERRLEGVPSKAAPPAVPPPPPRPAAEAAVVPQPGSTPEGAVAEAAPPPAAAPGQIEVDEEAAATALERALVQEGALLLPAGVMQVQPSFTYVRREADAPTLLGPRGGEVAAATETRRNDLTAGLTLRLGLPFDSQLALSVPYRYRDTSTVTRLDFAGIDEESRDESGFGDLAVTVSKGLLRERGWRPDLIARATWDTDTGQTDDGVRLGSGFHEVAGSLTAVKSQDPLVFVADLSYSHAFEDDDIRPGDVFGVSLGTVLAASPETSLRFFLDQSFVTDTEVDGRTIPGSDDVVGVLSIGASSILTSRLFLDFEVGIGLTEAAPDYFIGVALPIRFNLPARF